MIELLNPNTTPPGGFRYLVPETKQWIPPGYPRDMVYSFNDLEEGIVKHYKANHLDVPANLRELVLIQLCQQLPSGHCRDGNRVLGFLQGIAAEFSRVLQGTRVLADWWISTGRQRVPVEESARRAAICAGCIFNQEPQGCSSCSMKALNDAANSVVGGDTQPFDAQLKSCLICACNLRAKVRLQSDVLRRHIPPKQLNQLPPAHNGWPGCWLLEDKP